MVIHEDKLIFVHIPKCAGTSIEFALLKHTGSTFNEEKFRISHFPLGKAVPDSVRQKYILNRNRQHNPIRWFANRNKYYAFTVVRNPWDRFISTWKYAMTCRRNTKIRRMHDQRNMTFDEFCRAFVHEPGTLRLGVHIKKQMGFVGPALNRICRFENLEQDFAFVCKEAGLPDLELPRINVSPGGDKPYREYYENPETRKIVDDFVERDANLLGYEF